MKKMDWKKTINKLQAQGYTQVELSKISGLTQGTISYLKTGKQEDCHYSYGIKLVNLLK